MKFATTTLLSTLAALSTATPLVPWQQVFGKLPCWPQGVSLHVFEHTHTMAVVATPEQVVNGTVATPGQHSAMGLYKFGLQPATNTICYNITLLGVTGQFASPAVTATHIHEAAEGASGPPRIAFPNPVGDDIRKVSVGCLTGPFVTGVKDMMTGLDTGEGFHVQRLVDHPAAFMADVHTDLFMAGAVRGQLA